MDRRRDFITLLGGAALARRISRARQGRVRRIGVLMQFRRETSRRWQAWVAAFREGLQKLGWAEGRNIRSDYRWGGTDRRGAQAVCQGNRRAPSPT